VITDDAGLGAIAMDAIGAGDASGAGVVGSGVVGSGVVGSSVVSGVTPRRNMLINGFMVVGV